METLTTPLFLGPVLVGMAFVILGFVMIKFPPKRMNVWYGYRTTSSMKSQKRWEFAQRYSGKESVKLGFFLLLIGGVRLFWEPALPVAHGLSAVAIIGGIIGLLVRVESAIKRRFS